MLTVRFIAGQLDLWRQYPRQATLFALLLWRYAVVPAEAGRVCEQWVSRLQAFPARERDHEGGTTCGAAGGCQWCQCIEAGHVYCIAVVCGWLSIACPMNVVTYPFFILGQAV